MRKTGSGKSRDYRDAIVFEEKLRFQNVVRPRESEKPVFVCGIKIVFKKLRLRDGLMWAVGLTVETKLRLQFLRHSMCGVLTLHLEPKQNS